MDLYLAKMAMKPLQTKWNENCNIGLAKWGKTEQHSPNSQCLSKGYISQSAQ